MLRQLFRALHLEDDGQDLIEYSLLMAFLALASVGIFMQVGSTEAGVWAGARTTISGAATTASGTSSNAVTPANNTGSSGGGHQDHDGRH